MNAVALADRGRVRNSNQDTVFAENHPVGASPNLYIVADGMSGHRAGNYCSQTLTARVVSVMQENGGKLPLPALRDTVLPANEGLFTEAKRHAELEGMGSILAAVFLEERSTTVLNIGDSRCYAGFTGGSFHQVTRDHSYIEEMVSTGKVQRGNKVYKESKNVTMRVIGASAEAQMDLLELLIENLALFLLCTNGLTNMLEDVEIREILSETVTLKEETEKPIQAANMKGGRDNVSVVLADLREEAGVQ